ncbi:CRISPR-associated protein Csx3 [Archaeoglobus fulgidus]|uniref:CRISPR-associated protein Csx3 n=1 Tax=Archaeoglobus fulgidus TaxID=2234 RepID=UPI00373AF19B
MWEFGGFTAPPSHASRCLSPPFRKGSCKQRKIIAVYDPDLQTAIIVSSHLRYFKLGDLIQLRL